MGGEDSEDIFDDVDPWSGEEMLPDITDPCDWGEEMTLRYSLKILVEEGIIDSAGNFLLRNLSKEEAEKRIARAVERLVELIILTPL
jgi:hypothetical protein